MKKILFAWIEQILEFDSETEFEGYLKKLDSTHTVYKVLSSKTKTNTEGAVLEVRIRKNYNKNAFPDN